MAKIFSEDAYFLGLLYVYIYADKKMVLKDDLDKFHEIIEFNLKNMNIDINDSYATVWYDNDSSIYFASEGKNGEIYYVLYPDFDLNKAKSKYMGCLSNDILVASQKENALECLGLQLKDGQICRKKNYHIGIVGSHTFIKQFIEKLKNGELKIETCPQVDVGYELNEEFIIQQLESYQRLLDSKILQEVNEEKNELEETTSKLIKKLISNKKR